VLRLRPAGKHWTKRDCNLRTEAEQDGNLAALYCSSAVRRERARGKVADTPPYGPSPQSSPASTPLIPATQHCACRRQTNRPPWRTKFASANVPCRHELLLQQRLRRLPCQCLSAVWRQESAKARHRMTDL